jgi:hypothetical protein
MVQDYPTIHQPLSMVGYWNSFVTWEKIRLARYKVDRTAEATTAMTPVCAFRDVT